MSFEIYWTQHALDTVREQADYLAAYTARDPEEWVHELFDVVAKLRAFPRIAPPWRPIGDSAFRQLVHGRYAIIYRVSEEDGIVHVLSVRDARQRPPEPEGLR